MLLEVGVKAIIKNRKGKYLVLKRLKPYQGETDPRWDVPGGRIIPGEELSAALKREIAEETGLEMIGKPSIIHAQDILRVKDKHTVRLTFLAKTKGKVSLDQKEHSEYQWVSLKEFKQLHHDLYLTDVLKLL